MIRAARTYASTNQTPPPAGKGESGASFNGNITELERYAGVDKIDDLEYYYDHEDHATKTSLGSNRLYLVDEQSTHPGGNDLKKGVLEGADFNPNTPSSWNYDYDPIGNLIKDVNDSIDLITWTVTGKVSEVVFDPAKQNYNLAFRYDPMGNRIAKIQKPHNSLANCTTWTVTWYARDAQGNVLAVYNKAQDSLNFSATEFNIYGSSRIGMVTQPEALNETPQVPMAHAQTLGLKVYEFSNHLGNVLTTFSDRKIATEGASGYGAYYNAEILSSTDYYPFGFQMPGRVYEGDGYRYGFNGKEQDPETYGKGNIYDYGFRIYNPRIGKFLSVDPLFSSYPWNSVYSFAENDVIRAIDLDGLEKHIVIQYCYNGIHFGSTIYSVPKRLRSRKHKDDGILIIEKKMYEKGQTIQNGFRSRSRGTLKQFIILSGQYLNNFDKQIELNTNNNPVDHHMSNLEPNQTGDYLIVQDFNIYFETRSPSTSEIAQNMSSQEEQQLAQMAAAMLDPDFNKTMIITGYASATPTPYGDPNNNATLENNQKLSEDRAINARNWMLNFIENELGVSGFDANRITINWVGAVNESNKVPGSQVTDECNQRVYFELK
jgi:RHS repeat-associated protein